MRMFKTGDKRDKLGHSLSSNIILYIMKTDKQEQFSVNDHDYC